MANRASRTRTSARTCSNAGRERNTLISCSGALSQTEQQASYWRDQYQNEPYVTKGQKFDEYAPAYRTGYEGRSQYAGQRFDDVENNLKRDYENNRGNSPLGWDKAKQACRAAWDRADQFVSPQTDRQQGALSAMASKQRERQPDFGRAPGPKAPTTNPCIATPRRSRGRNGPMTCIPQDAGGARAATTIAAVARAASAESPDAQGSGRAAASRVR